jgi:hypothetical protein
MRESNPNGVENHRISPTRARLSALTTAPATSGLSTKGRQKLKMHQGRVFAVRKFANDRELHGELGLKRKQLSS